MLHAKEAGIRSGRLCLYLSLHPTPGGGGGKGYIGFQVTDRRIFWGLKFSPFSPKSPVFKNFVKPLAIFYQIAIFPIFVKIDTFYGAPLDM